MFSENPRDNYFELLNKHRIVIQKYIFSAKITLRHIFRQSIHTRLFKENYSVRPFIFLYASCSQSLAKHKQVCMHLLTSDCLPPERRKKNIHFEEIKLYLRASSRLHRTCYLAALKRGQLFHFIQVASP